MMFRSIGRKFRRDPGRWLAIALAVFMGMSLWSGCFTAGTGLLQGGVRYAETQNLYDLAVTANCGFSQAELEAIDALAEVEQVEGVYTGWGILEDADERRKTAFLRSVTESIDLPCVVSGRLPETGDECALDAAVYDEFAIGSTVTLRETDGSDGEYTVVGIVSLPEYPGGAPILTERGSAESFVLLAEEAFSRDGWQELRLTVTERGELWSRKYEARLREVTAALEGAAKTAVYSRHATILAQAQMRVTAAETALTEIREEYNERFGDEAMALVLLQADCGAAETLWLASAEEGEALELEAQNLIGEAARIEAEDSAIQRDWADYRTQRDTRLAVLEEEKAVLDQTHYDMEYAVVDLEALIGEAENSLYILPETEHDRVGLEIMSYREEILRLQTEYAAMEETYLANETAFETWRTETVASLNGREAALLTDRENYAEDSTRHEAAAEAHAEAHALLEEAYLALKDDVAEAETALLTGSMDLLTAIADGEAELETAQTEAERLEKPVLRCIWRWENGGYADLHADGTSLHRLSLPMVLACLLLVLWPCCRAAREERREQEGAERALAKMGLALPVRDCCRCACASGIIGGAAGVLCGSFLGFRTADVVYGAVYTVPVCLRIRAVLCLLAAVLFCGIAVWGITATAMRRVPGQVRRSVSVPAAGRLHPALRGMLRDAGSRPGKWIAAGGTALVSMILLCTAFSAVDSRIAAGRESLEDHLLPLTADSSAETIAAAAAAEAEFSVPVFRGMAEIGAAGNRAAAELVIFDTLPEGVFSGELTPEEGTAALSADIAGRLGILAGDRITLTLSDGNGVQLPVGLVVESGPGCCVIVERSALLQRVENLPEANTVFLRLQENGSADRLESDLELPVQPVEPVPESRFGGILILVLAVLMITAVTAGLYAACALPSAEEKKRRAYLRLQGIDGGNAPLNTVMISAAGAIPGVLAGICISALCARVLRGMIRWGGQSLEFRLSTFSLCAGAVIVLAAAIGGGFLAACLPGRSTDEKENTEEKREPEIG